MIVFELVIAFCLVLSAESAATRIAKEHPHMSSIVSARWVFENLESPALAVVDPLWYKTTDNETLVMPDTEVLHEGLGANGLVTDRYTVLVTGTKNLPGEVAMATRAAATLWYAGMPVKNVGILDGGYTAWLDEKLNVSTTPGLPSPTTFKGNIDGSFIVDREYVRARIGKVAEGSVIVDARPRADFDNGHIKSAFSLPATTIFEDGGVWKTAEELQKIFDVAIGDAPVSAEDGEVIVYCWVGMMATPWLYALRSVLGFNNVKLYDGSFEDWIKYYEGVPTAE